MRLDQLEVVLTLAEELHFGRTAQRLHISQSRVSKVVALLERELGGVLFDRTSRTVRMTPLGRRFVERVGAAYRELLGAVDDVAREAQPLLRIGFVRTTGGSALARLVRDFERIHPETSVRLRQLPYHDPYGALRDDLIDVLVLWRTDVEPGITAGPVIDRQDRVAAMATGNPLAGRDSISVLDVQNWGRAADIAPPAMRTTFLPLTAPDGTPIPRSDFAIGSLPETLARIANGEFVLPTVRSFAELAHREDIALVPIRDLPPLDLILLWWTTHEHQAIRNLAAVARRPVAG